jgi:hypothetical protein
MSNGSRVAWPEYHPGQQSPKSWQEYASPKRFRKSPSEEHYEGALIERYGTGSSFALNTNFFSHLERVIHPI